MLVEVLMAGLLLGLAMFMAVSLLAGVAGQRRSVERRGWALQEAANAMERLSAIPFEQLSQEVATAQAKLSASAEKVLHGGQIEVKISDEKVGPPMKKIEVAVHWSATNGFKERPVRLTSWVSRKEARR
jgi:hypothetical protein